MARIRSIKPEFFTSLAVASLPLEARLTFIGLWTHVDDEGRAVDDARLIKAALWPLDDRVSADVEGDLRILSEASLITRYRVGERSFLAVTNWGEHQRINRPTASKLPSPTNADRSPPPNPPPPPPTRGDEDFSESRQSPHGGLTEDSLPERKGTGNREQGTTAHAPLDAEPVTEADLPFLFVVPESGSELAVRENPNAGSIAKDWIDYCSANDLKLPTSIIKRYGMHIRKALNQGAPERLIRSALGAMFRDRVVSRPALFDTYLTRIQQGPELPPERLSRHQADAERRAAEAGTTADRRLFDTLTRDA